MIIQYVLEVIVILLIGYGILHEEELVRWENRHLPVWLLNLLGRSREDG